MQNRYVGDVGDFVKYGLLRAIRGLTGKGALDRAPSAPGFAAKPLGVAWYLHPDAGPAGDGGHTAYLKEPEEWRHLDPELFDSLKKLIGAGTRRAVKTIQESGILGDAVLLVILSTSQGSEFGNVSNGDTSGFAVSKISLSTAISSLPTRITGSPWTIASGRQDR